MMPRITALLWVFVFFVCAALPAAAKTKKGPAESDRYYTEGVALYARGDLAQALSSFKRAQKRHPGDRTVEAAVARARADLIASAMRRSPVPVEDPSIMDSLDSMLTEDLPQLVAFDEIIGDADSAQGTLGAIQGRVSQLLSEEKVAKRHHRRFRKAAELRALARRMPAVMA